MSAHLPKANKQSNSSQVHPLTDVQAAATPLLQLDKEDRRLLLLAGLLLPLRRASCVGPKGKPVSAVFHIVREALK